MKINPEDIFTPQGKLEDVEKNPNLDFLMNIFNIPRAFGVSGFGGNWNVGKHSYATALVALRWAKENGFPPDKRDRLTTLATLHDLHESVTGDLLPMFKTPEIRERFNILQKNLLESLGVEDDPELKADLKLMDLISFLYEIRQVSPSILNSRKLELANTIAQKQREIIFSFAEKNNISKGKVESFLKSLEIN